MTTLSFVYVVVVKTKTPFGLVEIALCVIIIHFNTNIMITNIPRPVMFRLYYALRENRIFYCYYYYIRLSGTCVR